MLQQTLPSHKYRISVAQDGDEGFRMACAEKPDCIVFEVDLMPTSGTLMYSRLRRNTATRHLPMLVYSEIQPRYGTGIRTVRKSSQDSGELCAAVRELLGDTECCH